MKTVPKKTILALCLSSVTGLAYSHGYVSTKIDGSAASRVALCKFASPETNQKNTDCGAIQWEPQSVEGPDGFPANGPADGKIASAGSAIATALDEQTADRWVKQSLSAGLNKFEWTFTAPHVTKDWNYYITKSDWNPNQQLSRDAFDLTPFCSVDGNMVKPGGTTTHECDVPAREGYHVILAVWDVGDTAAAFYNVIDVQFDDQTAPSEWRAAGQILPTMDLNVGDVVYTRVFDHAGENPQWSTKLTIDEQTTSAKQWSYALAQKINQTQSQIKAGKREQDDQFTAQFGTNPIYLHTGSNLERVEIGYQLEQPEIEHDLTVSGLASDYQIEANRVELSLSLLATGHQTVELTAYNHDMQALANQTLKMNDGDARDVTMLLDNVQAGHHMLVVRSKDQQGELLEQTTFDFMLNETVTPPTGDYDFVFPNGLDTYTDGTKVLAEDGQVYQCKGFPYSGYCKQWTETATQYQPGSGSHWSMAWDKL